MHIFQTIDDPKLIDLLLGGAVGVLPSDTVYGLVCRAKDTTAAERLYATKSREHKPGTLIAANVDQLVDLGLKKRYLTAVADYWPNPLSVIIPCGKELAYLHQGKDSLAVRIPANDHIRALLEKTGVLLTTSANKPGEPTAINIDEAERYFDGGIDFYVDGGTIADHLPSTVIRIVDDAIEVLREGAVKIDENGRITN